MTKKTDTLPAPAELESPDDQAAPPPLSPEGVAELHLTNVPAYRVMATDMCLDGERWCKWLKLCPLDHDGMGIMVGDFVNVLKVGE